MSLANVIVISALNQGFANLWTACVAHPSLLQFSYSQLISNRPHRLIYSILSARILLHLREASWKGSLGVEVDEIGDYSTVDRIGSIKITSALVIRGSGGDILSSTSEEMETWFGAGREFGVSAGAGTGEMATEMRERRQSESNQS